MPRKKNLEFIEDENGCFVVTSHVQKCDGYSEVERNYKRMKSHRLIDEQCFGLIPRDKVVGHKCDNKMCINPEHLELGTPGENSQDMVKRGRSKKGEEHHYNTRLSSSEVREILNDRTLSQKELAVKYGVTASLISMVKLRKRWKHVRVVPHE